MQIDSLCTSSVLDKAYGNDDCTVHFYTAKGQILNLTLNKSVFSIFFPVSK